MLVGEGLKFTQELSFFSPTSPLIFTGQKIWNLASFKMSLSYELHVWKCSKIAEFWNISAMLR